MKWLISCKLEDEAIFIDLDTSVLRNLPENIEDRGGFIS